MEYGIITIKGTEKKIVVRKGTDLLTALLRGKILIPSSCGGKGVCGRCKVKIINGDFISEPTGKINYKENSFVYSISGEIALYFIINFLKMMLVLKNIDRIYICDDNFTIKENSSIYVENGVIKKIGKVTDSNIPSDARVINCEGYVCLPGFVDCHTHLIYGGDRIEEFGLKLKGVPYLEILKRGGGIISTMRNTRGADSEKLEQLLMQRLKIILEQGTTTCEIKTGYGLSPDHEERLLKILQKVKNKAVQDIVITYMGAHAVPEGVPRQRYIDSIIYEGIPMAMGYAEFCDIFCERGVFSYEESKRILKEAVKYRLIPKVHADELSDSKGAYLAFEIGAISCEHMVYSNLKGIRKMKEKDVKAVLLPATSFFLRKKFANAIKIKNEGVKIALATDHNPGTSPCFSLLTVSKIALFRMNMDIKDVLLGITLNAARAINREQRLGSIEKGKQADFVLFKVPDVHYLFYNFDFCFKKIVIKKGEIVYS